MIFDFDSTHGFLNAVLEQKSARNKKFSLRAMAKNIGVSPSALSSILNAAKAPSPGTVLKISHWLKLGKKEHEYLDILAQLETAKTESVRRLLTKKMGELKPSLSTDAIARVRDLLVATTVAAAYIYCIPGTSRTRTLIRLKDPKTKRLLKSFYESVLMPDLFVSDTFFFIENPDGTFDAFQNQNLNGQGNFPEFVEKNRNLRVTFDKSGFPTIHNLTMHWLAARKYTLANLVFSKTTVKICEGKVFEAGKAPVTLPAEVEYRAIR